MQLGLVSWGPSLDKMDELTWDVNTDVAYYRDWINDVNQLVRSLFSNNIYSYS